MSYSISLKTGQWIYYILTNFISAIMNKYSFTIEIINHLFFGLTNPTKVMFKKVNSKTSFDDKLEKDMKKDWIEIL